MLSAIKEFVGIKPRSYTLTVPRIEENEGLLLLGDPGTGKSQLIHQLLDNIAKRKPQEAVVVYDPAGALAARYGVEGMPSTFVYSRDGDLVARHLGFQNSKRPEYEALLGRLLQ